MSSNRLLQLQGIWTDIFAVQLGSSFVCRSFHVLVCCFWSSQLGPESTSGQFECDAVWWDWFDSIRTLIHSWMKNKVPPDLLPQGERDVSKRKTRKVTEHCQERGDSPQSSQRLQCYWKGQLCLSARVKRPWQSLVAWLLELTSHWWSPLVLQIKEQKIIYLWCMTWPFRTWEKYSS